MFIVLANDNNGDYDDGDVDDDNDDDNNVWFLPILHYVIYVQTKDFLSPFTESFASFLLASNGYTTILNPVTPKI